MHDTLHKLHFDAKVGLPYLTTTLCYKTHLPFFIFFTCLFCRWDNLSLGGTTRNTSPQIFETHPTLQQQ
jgi:hypothetical protein